MTLPDDAVFEAQVAGGVALWDVTDVLPRHKTKRYGVRREPVRRLFTHHSGALGRNGYEGMAASARFVTRAKLLGGRGWAGFAYTFWFARVPDLDARGNLVIYRGNRDETVSNHTGGTNHNSASVVWQGNSSKLAPSDAQIEMAEAFYPWWLERHRQTLGVEPLSFHGEAGKHGGRSKRSCPGMYVEGFLTAYRKSIGAA